MAQIKKGELGRVPKAANWDKETGNALKGYNAESGKPLVKHEPNQGIAGPGAAVPTPYTERAVDEIMEPRVAVKGTGKEEARIDHGYGTLAAALKDGKTDF
jgi:hypothetical protein